MNTFARNGVVFSIHGELAAEETARYAIEAYGHVIEDGKTLTPAEFAQRIETVYSTSNSANAAIVSYLRSHE